MTRAEYLAELDSHLITLPKEERDMAVAFYEEYFEDAGPEKEQSVIDELGKPFNLARSIIGETSAYNKSEVYIKYRESKPMPQNSTGVFASLKKPGAFPEAMAAAAIPGNTDVPVQPDTEPETKEDQEEDIMPEGMPERDQSGFTFEQDAQPKFEEKKEENQNQPGMFDQFYTHAGTDSPPPPPKKKSMSAGWIVFWVLISIFVIIPIVLPIIIAMALIAIAAVGCLLAAPFCFIGGIITFFSSIPWSLILISGGLLSAGFGLIFMSGSVAFFGKLMPWSIKGIIRLAKRGDA